MHEDWRAIFEQTYAGAPSATEERVWRAVLGEEYPAGIDPHSFITVTELERFARELALPPGGVLVDAGCGRGGAGLWVAAATGARLVGIDIAEAPLVDARGRASAMGIDAVFQRGEFEHTGLPDGVADGVMSVDALLFTPDKAAALHELRRILRPGGRLVLTSWDYHSQPAGRPPQIADHRPVAAAAGFTVLAYEDTEDWLGRQRAIDAGLLAHAAELADEAGVPDEVMRAEIEEMDRTLASMIRRFLIVAVAEG